MFISSAGGRVVRVDAQPAGLLTLLPQLAVVRVVTELGKQGAVVAVVEAALA